jgi:predicted transcriptional regulator
MSSTECMELANYGPYQDRVNYFLKKAAIAIMAESDQTANHADRVAYSAKVLGENARIFPFAVGTTTNPTLAATVGTNDAATANAAITDGDLEYTVNSLFDAYAG